MSEQNETIQEKRDEASVTARSFNPDNNPHVDHIKSTIDGLANYLEENIEPGRRRSIALTQLEQASMWAVKSVFYR